MPDYFGKQIDDFFQQGLSVPKNEILSYAIQKGGFFILLAIIAGFFLFLTRQTIIVVSRYIEYDLKNEIYQQYQRLNYSFYRKNSTGDLMNRITEDVSRVRMYLGPSLMYLINLVIVSILIIGKMISINPTLTLYVLIPLPIMSFLIYKVSATMNRLSGVVQKEQSQMSTYAQEYFAGIRVMKAYSKTDYINENFGSSAEKYLKKVMSLVKVNALFIPVIFLLIGVSTIIVIYLGGLLHFENPEALTQGNIITFIFYVNMLTWPFASLGWVTSLIQRASASQERINEFLNEKPEISNTNFEDFDFQGGIEFKNVTLDYPTSNIRALENISFTLKAGDHLGVVGKTGSGKSSLLRLLTREVDVTSGEILIDGNSIKNINLDDFRSQLGIVPQEVILFSDTIANNLRFGTKKTNTSLDELKKYTQKAHVLHNIERLKNGFETKLGERGVNLSGGQKQRISIARALIRNPKILLLDDCLSAVDTETEEIILRNLSEENHLNTITISHRISTIRNANKIIVLDEGKIVEQGTHESLLKQNGQYAEMYQKQLVEG